LIFGLTVYLLFFKSSFGTGDLFGQKENQKNQAAIIAKMKERDNAVKSVPVYGLDGSGKTMAEVSKDKVIKQDTWAKPPADAAVNERLAKAEAERIAKIHGNNNYWTDEDGLRHYLDGRVVQIVYQSSDLPAPPLGGEGGGLTFK
jgi:hypothetical protein